MGYCPCIGANFGPSENALVFRILCVFWSCFFAQHSSNVVVQSFFASFGCFFLHGHFENGLVFPKLGVFWSAFLHWTFLNWSHKRFSYLFSVWNFWQKLTMHRGIFWPFLKCSRLSNIRYFLQRFFGHNISNVVAQSFFIGFGTLNFWHKLTILHGL